MVGQATTDALFADFFLYCNVIQVGFSKGAHKLYDPEFSARVPQLLDLVLQSWTKVLGTVLQYSDFSVISLFPLKTVHPFRNFLAVLPPPPYTKLKLGKNSGYTRPTLFVGWGEGLDLCELENAPETQKCPKTFVHDCSFKCRWSGWAQSKQGVPIMPACPFHVALYLFELIEGTLQKKIGCSVIDPALYGIRSQGSRVGVCHTASHGCCSCRRS